MAGVRRGGPTMTATSVVFLDTETTGLDPARHDVWEVGLIVDGQEITYRIRPLLATADAYALSLTDYYRRTNATDWKWDEGGRDHVARRIATLTAGRHLVGAVPSFDAPFLDRFLRANGAAPAWHYHLVDVEALAAGKVGIAPPWDSEELSRAVGVDPTQFERHTALGDARWAKAIYEAVVQS